MTRFDALLPELKAHFTGHWLTDMANFSAFVYQHLPDLNWAGFYLDDGATLRLGPFVGRPACTEIAYSRGVCGAAFRQRASLLVDDVHEFPGHIACDSASRSEMVLPIIVASQAIGVFDLDSPRAARFSEEDRAGVSLWLEAFVAAQDTGTWSRRPWA